MSSDLPSLSTASTDMFCSRAMFPIVANEKIPTSKLLHALIRETATVSTRMVL